MDRFLRIGRFASSEFTDDEEDSGEFELPPELRRAETLRAQAARLPPEDPNLDQLLALTRSTGEGEGPRKTLVFSFFIHTLHYLKRHLEQEGFRVGLVTGQVPEDERETLRARFRRDPGHADSLDILLSSEVGCEGLDYEFCDRLVNYDIPWNPMRLEQRIGRIDRFGQKNPKVLIFNFVTPGTVEERIFFRCFDRLSDSSEIGPLAPENLSANELRGMVRDVSHALLGSLSPDHYASR